MNNNIGEFRISNREITNAEWFHIIELKNLYSILSVFYPHFCPSPLQFHMNYSISVFFFICQHFSMWMSALTNPFNGDGECRHGSSRMFCVKSSFDSLANDDNAIKCNNKCKPEDFSYSTHSHSHSQNPLKIVKQTSINVFGIDSFRFIRYLIREFFVLHFYVRRTLKSIECNNRQRQTIKDECKKDRMKMRKKNQILVLKAMYFSSFKICTRFEVRELFSVCVSTIECGILGSINMVRKKTKKK